MFWHTHIHLIGKGEIASRITHIHTYTHTGRGKGEREWRLLRQNQSPKIAKWDREERVFIEAKSVSRIEIYTHMS